MLPSLFIAHGSPLLAIEDNAYTTAIRELTEDLTSLKGIIIFSAHYETAQLTVNRTMEYSMIYDFGGFPDALYRIQYPAHGEISLINQVEALLRHHDISYVTEGGRGLDHGAWVVLRLLRPEADVPVLALSVSPSLLPQQQYAIGKALQGLREDGILIVGSGGTVHNLRAVMWDSDQVADWALEFDLWLEQIISTWDLDTLFHFRELAPGAQMAVPPSGSEHFIPLLYAMGAADNTRNAILKHRSYRYGTLSHTIWQFD